MESLSAIARREEIQSLCEACHAAPGIRFTDRRWVCCACAEEILEMLTAEQSRPARRLRASNLPQACIDKIRDWRARA
jgi:hypothetical protein